MSSGTYKSAIAPAKARLGKALADAESRDYRIQDGITNEVRLTKLRQLVEGAKEDISKIESASSTIEKWMDKWIFMLRE